MNPSTIGSSQKLERVQNASHSVQSMIELAAVLREPGGCDWDRKQDLNSMQPHLLEEAHELIHAIQTLDVENFKEELGDLLFLVVFFARLAQEKGWFDLYDAARASVDKLVFRHPHVFGDLKVSGAGEVLKNWEKLKEQEKEIQKQGRSPDRPEDQDGPHTTLGGETEAATSGATDGDPSKEPSEFGKKTAYLPALHRAEKLQKKAALKGFDWDNIVDVRKKLDEELGELDELIESLQKNEVDASVKSRLSDELGDVLFCVVNLARHLDVPAELSLHGSCEKFIARFRAMEDMSSVPLEGLSLEKLEE